MKLYAVSWKNNSEETYDDVKSFINHMIKKYPNLIDSGDSFKVDNNLSNPLSWLKRVDAQLINNDGIGVAVINIEGEKINQFFNSDTVVLTYVAGLNSGMYNGKLIVINEGVLHEGNPSEELFELRKSKVGMHELLEDLLLIDGLIYSHDIISHYDQHKDPAFCVNDRGSFFVLQANKPTKEKLTVDLIDHATDYYCQECEERFLKSLKSK